MLFLYRKNGGQVLGVSTDPLTFASVDPTYFATIQDPLQPDGPDIGVPKIWDGTNLRNATAQEQTTFVTAATTDLNLQQRSAAISRLQADPVLRKILRAIVGQVVTQLNVLRARTEQNPIVVSPLPAITENQAETAIVNAINAGTFD